MSKDRLNSSSREECVKFVAEKLRQQKKTDSQTKKIHESESSIWNDGKKWLKTLAQLNINLKHLTSFYKKSRKKFDIFLKDFETIDWSYSKV